MRNHLLTTLKLSSTRLNMLLRVTSIAEFFPLTKDFFSPNISAFIAPSAGNHSLALTIVLVNDLLQIGFSSALPSSAIGASSFDLNNYTLKEPRLRA